MADIDYEIVEYLVAKSREGDREAFSDIVRMMMKDVVALTYRMTQDREIACDLAQDTFISAWQKLPEFRGDAKLQSWLYRIAANKTLNCLKQRSCRREIPLDDAPISAMPSESILSDPDRSLQGKELQKAVLEFMAELPPQQRLIFDLHFYKQQTFEEIARMTGKAVGTVKTNYREAVIKLRDWARQKGWHR
jgi:RNA polymerase sigma-70 factor (ECF subfamily)